ncbi:MAG: glycerol-3-phosphate acyltransferase, partial [Fidelibacterota bacterium]
LCLVVFIVTLILTGYVSLSSIMASVSLPVFLLLLPAFFNVETQFYLLVFGLFIPWFIIYTHRSNIQRLRNGTENRFEKAMIFRKKN